MTTEAVVRDAAPEDRPRLVAFMSALQEHERASEPNRTPGPEMADSHLAVLEAWAAEQPGGSVLVAEIAGDVVAFSVTGIETEGGTYIPEENRAVGKISDLWVEPAYRGRGIARALIRMAEARLRAAGVRRAEISAIPANADALRLYRSLGYSDYLVTVGRML